MSSKGLFRHFSVYLVANAIGAVISLGSVVVYSHVLEPSEFGLFSVFIATLGLAAVFLPLNAHAAVSRYFYEQKDDFPSFFGTSVHVVIAICIASAALSFPFWPRLEEALDAPPGLLFFVVVATFGRVAQSLHAQIKQARQESRESSLVAVGSQAVQVALAIGLIFTLSQDRYWGPVWSWGIVSVGLVLVAMWRLRPFYRPAFDPAAVRYILTYAVPLIPYQLGGTILATADQLMISHFLGNADTGIYSMAYRIGMVQALVTDALLTAWMPYYFRHMNEEAYGTVDDDIGRFSRLLAIGAVGLIAFGDEIGRLLLDPSYHAGLALIPTVVLGYTFFGFSQFYVRGIGYAKKTAWSAVVLIAAAVINIAANAVLIPRMGYAAAAYTTALSYGAMFIVGWAVNRFVLNIHTPPVRRLVLPLCGVLCAFAAVTPLSDAELSVRLGSKMVLVPLLTWLLLGRSLRQAIFARLPGRA